MQTKDEIKTETKDNPIDTAIKDAEKAEKEFDKERQKADQDLASKVMTHPTFKRVSAEKARLDTELEVQKRKAQDLEAQIKELQAGKAAEKDVADLIPDIDPENASVEDYGKAMKQMRVVIANLNKKLAQVETKGDQSEAARKKEREIAAEQEQRNKTFNKVCDRLEKKHGPGLRNRAIELMEQRVATEGDPENQAEATLMLDDCFAEAKTEAAKKPKDKKVVTDTGGGGRVSFGNVQIKKGSLDEVFEQFERASKTG